MPFVTVYRKPEYPPLLPIGRHPMALADIRQLCVERFPRSATRDGIMCGVEFVISVLAGEGIAGDVWIDGSFLTLKDDPDDADLVLYMDSAFSDRCTPAQKRTVEWFQDDAETLHKWVRCHCFPIVRWPEGHADYWVGEYNYAYWMKYWGFSQSDVPKGMAVVKLP